jgi:hypothetical protein
MPSAILSFVTLVASLTFYSFTTFVSIFDKYAPFSSPVSRGLTALANILQAAWTGCNLWHNLSGTSFHSSRPQEHNHDADSSQEIMQPIPGNNGVAKQPRHPEGVKKKEVVSRSRSRSQVDHQVHVDILEWLVRRTAGAVENIPIFLELLDLPVKNPTLRPSDIERWKDLLHITLGLLGDPSAYTESTAYTVARTVLFCYNRETVDQQLYPRLQYLFDQMGSDTSGGQRSLNSLFSSYLHSLYRRSPFDPDGWGIMCDTIAFLEPSNAADTELLWMVNTIHRNQSEHQYALYHKFLKFYAAVLTYVSSTEQSRRSQIPLTAAVIYAVHTIKSALDQGSIDSIRGSYLLPMTVLTSESVPMTFCQVNSLDTLDLWNNHCVKLAYDLLQPSNHWLGSNAEDVWRFQLPLIAALYIDSTKSASNVSSAIVKLLTLTNIPTITLDTWNWPDAYDHTKLAGYWYMTLFQIPLNRDWLQKLDIGFFIMKTVDKCSELKLSALHLLDTAVKHLCMTATSSNWLTRNNDNNLVLSCTPPVYTPSRTSLPSNPWLLLHLETLFAQNLLLLPEELEELEWHDTPEEAHIAKARVAHYNSLEREEHQGTKQLMPDPQLLNMFLRSKDHGVCTGAFQCCLSLVPIGQPSAVEDVDGPRTFIPETMGHEWIEHLIQVLCGGDEDDQAKSWRFLAKHLVPKWIMLPSSWCNGFALAFLFSSAHLPGMNERPAYQHFAEALRGWTGPATEAFSLFLATVLARSKSSLTWGRLTTFETWLAHHSGRYRRLNTQVQIETILATRKQQLVEEALGFFAELPMADSRMNE